MGISPFKSSECDCESGYSTDSQMQREAKARLPENPGIPGMPWPPKGPPPGAPDPRKFGIDVLHAVGEWLAAKVHYPDAGNFGGTKILVFHGVQGATLQSLRFLDPHFCERAHISPVARFVPTRGGWRMALAFIRLMADEGL